MEPFGGTPAPRFVVSTPWDESNTFLQCSFCTMQHQKLSTRQAGSGKTVQLWTFERFKDNAFACTVFPSQKWHLINSLVRTQSLLGIGTGRVSAVFINVPLYCQIYCQVGAAIPIPGRGLAIAVQGRGG
mmetsp:Transcript_136712/g.237392  ORF Transcript_136712/g.237392 Transcript_136712/m.237392 type:complete len:129 (-) Transcript_136712:206-592(-)